MTCGVAHEDDVGLIFIIGSGGFDLSGNTELRMVFKKPDLTVVTKLSADGVTAPAVPWTGKLCPTDTEDTTYAANEYVQYASEVGLLDQTGGWSKHIEYVDATPKDVSGDVSNFSVLPRE
jgi:hypothetical protein